MLSQNEPEPVINVYHARSLAFITYVKPNIIVMWEITAAQQCRLGLFQDSDFAGHREDSKSTSGGILCIFGSHTFVPEGWMCKKQTSVSHSSTEAEIISLDAGLRMDGIPALDLWSLVIEVFHSSQHQLNNAKDLDVRRSLSRNTTSNKHTQNQTKVPTQHDNVDFFCVDCVPANVKFS